VRYRKKRKDDTAERELLRTLAAERRRFGYRRLREMAKRKGRHMNLKKVYRLYREEGLAVRRRRGGSVKSFSHIWFGLSGARHWLKR
jgi:putative transposase